MKKLILIIALFTLQHAIISGQTKRPNIIFIFADDLGYGEIGCYGQQKIETKEIDRMAANGLKFTRFYSGSTVCAPARTSFLTGMPVSYTHLDVYKRQLSD